MPAPPILNSTLAATYVGCDPANPGHATCIDANYITGSAVTNSLVIGDNVLAVEVHNHSSLSPSVTFGLAAGLTAPYTVNPPLNIATTNQSIVLSWLQGGFTLQQAGTVTGPWTNVPGPVFSSPFTLTNSGSTRFFRLIK